MTTLRGILKVLSSLLLCVVIFVYLRISEEFVKHRYSEPQETSLREFKSLSYVIRPPDKDTLNDVIALTDVTNFSDVTHVNDVIRSTLDKIAASENNRRFRGVRNGRSFSLNIQHNFIRFKIFKIF